MLHTALLLSSLPLKSWYFVITDCFCINFDFCKYGLEILFILISEIWGSPLNFVTKGSALLSSLASSWSPLYFYCSPGRVQTPPVSPLLLLDREKGPRSWCLGIVSHASVCEPSCRALGSSFTIFWACFTCQSPLALTPSSTGTFQPMTPRYP